MTEIARPRDHSARFGLSLPLLAGVFVYATTLLAWRRVLDDPDPFLHVVAGRWIIANGEVPHHDVFSHTMLGAPWVAHEWLAEVATAWLHDHVGWAGLVVATAICFAAAMMILVRSLLRCLEPSQALIAAVGTWGLCFPHLLARPHVYSWPFLTLWVAILVASRSEERAPPYILALLMVPWANLHGSYVFGLGLAALLAAEAVLEAPDRRTQWRVARTWSGFLGLSLVAGLLTPNGVSGMLFPFQLVRMESVLSMVEEWQSPNFQDGQPLEYWLMLALIGALSVGVRLPITRIAMLLMLLHMALVNRRHVEILGLLAPVIVAPLLAPQIRAYTIACLDRALSRFAVPTNGTAVALAGLLVVGLGLLSVRFGGAPEGRYVPAGAVAFVEERHVAGPVFNDYAFGDYLMYRGIAPFLDGRADMYGDAFIKRYKDIAQLPSLLAQYRVAWTLLKPGSPRAALMDYLPGWRRAYGDDIAVIHIRESQ